MKQKKKFQGVVYKRRADLPLCVAMNYLETGSKPPQGRQVLDEIDFFLKHYRLRVFLAYERFALVGREVLSTVPTKRFQTIVLSDPTIKQGASYTIAVNEENLVTFEVSETTTYVNRDGVTEGRQNGFGTQGQPGSGPNQGGRSGRE